jgi:hypothetical protein
LNFGNGSFAPPTSYPVGGFPSGLAIDDLDGDGDSDLAVVVPNVAVLIYSNGGTGAFATPVTYPSSFGFGIVAADLDLDGDVDLTASPEGVRLNQGNGTFSPPSDRASLASSRPLASADLDGDGDQDLIGTNTSLQGLVILRNCVTSGRIACPGDGSGSACPCANESTPGSNAGCKNSRGQGATLRGSGAATLTSDGFVLSGAGMPAGSPALYFQGTAAAGQGAGSPFGDGLVCAAGALIRMSVKTNANGGSTYPRAGEASVSSIGAITSAGERVYQVLYRDAPTFCTAASFNLTNGLRVSWAP